MFTGIIVGTGKVTKIDQQTKNRSAIQMTVNLGKYAKGLKIGQSVAINGVCLSATKISKNNVQICISKGLPVIEGNAEIDLQQFPNLSFDYVILSQTLQAFYNPEKVMDDLLRVANKAIVTIPNFGYWKVRLHLFFKGTMPVTKHLPNEWYNTPNLHMCTIQDFVNFCKEKNIKIDRSLCLTNEKIE